MSFIIYAAAGFASGLIGGMGMGGGTLLIPVLTVLLSVGQQQAQLTNLLSFLPMSVFSLAVHKKQGLIHTRGLAVLIIPALITSVMGSFVALVLPGALLRRLFGVFLIALAVRSAVGYISAMRKS